MKLQQATADISRAADERQPLHAGDIAARSGQKVELKPE
jgi:hypothetical protein